MKDLSGGFVVFSPPNQTIYRYEWEAVFLVAKVSGFRRHNEAATQFQKGSVIIILDRK
jgi:hypothetical protein